MGRGAAAAVRDKGERGGSDAEGENREHAGVCCVDPIKCYSSGDTLLMCGMFVVQGQLKQEMQRSADMCVEGSKYPAESLRIRTYIIVYSNCWYVSRVLVYSQVTQCSSDAGILGFVSARSNQVLHLPASVLRHSLQPLSGPSAHCQQHHKDLGKLSDSLSQSLPLASPIPVFHLSRKLSKASLVDPLSRPPFPSFFHHRTLISRTASINDKSLTSVARRSAPTPGSSSSLHRSHITLPGL
jgi:hypothetical protein